MTTLHTYPALIYGGGRLATTVWRGPGMWPSAAADAVAATLRQQADAVVLGVADASGRRVAIGLAPGGLAA